MGEEKCEAGCKRFHGGDIRHHKDCVYYPESMAKIIDDLKSKLEKAKTALNEIASWESGPVVNSGFDCPRNAETARKALEELE